MEVIPRFSSSVLLPILECNKIVGVPIAPAERITSFEALTVIVVPAGN